MLEGGEEIVNYVNRNFESISDGKPRQLLFEQVKNTLEFCLQVLFSCDSSPALAQLKIYVTYK
jgi:hypothetical protein